MTTTAAPPQTSSDDIQSIIDAHIALEGPLLPILHAVQAVYGCVPASAHAPIAAALNDIKEHGRI